MSPSLTAKPANSIVASLGTGTQALSSVIRMKMPATPIASTTSTAKLTIGSVIEARMSGLQERHEGSFGAVGCGEGLAQAASGTSRA